MAFIVTDGQPHVRLKTYDATIKGKTALLRVTIEVTDTFELTLMLSGLERLEAAQKEAARNRATHGDLRERRSDQPKKPSGRKKIEQQVMLALPPHFENEEG